MAEHPQIESRPPLHAAIGVGDVQQVAALLAGGAAAGGADERGVSALSLAAFLGRADIVSLLLVSGASPLQPDRSGTLPLHRAAARSKLAAARLLLAAAPEAASMPDATGHLPAHHAANAREQDGVELLQLLIEAAPGSLGTHIAADHGGLPLHCAVAAANAAAVQLLVAADSRTALVRSHPALGEAGLLPLQAALGLAAAASLRKWPRGGPPPAAFLDAARPLLAAMPPQLALPILMQRGQLALPLYADLAACWPLGEAQWQQVPAPCPGLGRALPAVLQRSEAEAALLVAHLPTADRQRLRAFALALHRRQQQLRVYLSTAILHRILSLFDA